MKTAFVKIFAVIFVLCILCLSMACGAPQGEEVPTDGEATPTAGTAVTQPHGELPTEAPTEVSTTSDTESETSVPDVVLVSGNSKLSEEEEKHRDALMDYYLAMFRDITANGKENVLFSPLSVFAATAMTTEGAKGETLSALEALMGISQADLSDAYRLCLGEAHESSSLLSANSLWIDTDESMTVNEATMQKIQSGYDAGFFYQDLQAPETLSQLNQWISDRTKGRIPQMMEETHADARFLLVNALSFDAEWYEAYYEHQQKEESFANADGSVSTVTMLSNAENYYIEDEHAQGFYKLYKTAEDGKRYAFVAILPEEGMTPAEYLASLDGDGLREMLYHYTTGVSLHTKMPVFSADTSYELSATYQRLGCQIPFMGGEADFSGLAVTDYPLYISRILHKASITVDGLGTEAGASTVIEMPECTAPMEPSIIKEVYLDRPFIYMIMDCDTGLPVFMGVTASV